MPTKKLLISSSSRTFSQLVAPLIPELAKHFEIVILLEVLKNVATPRQLYHSLEEWNKAGLVKDFIIAPDCLDGFAGHQQMKKNLALLKGYDFDVWLARSEMQISDRYILDCVVPKDCLKVAFWPVITYLLQREQQLAAELLSKSKKMQPFLPVKSLNTASNVTGKKKKTLKSIGGLVYRSIKRYFRTNYRFFLNRKLFPKLLVGKSFEQGPYDEITQLGSGRIDAYLFCDELEVEAHQALFENSKVLLCQYPTENRCTCDHSAEQIKKILCPLSGWEKDNLMPTEALQLLVRDIQIVVSETQVNQVDLRKHPDFGDTNGWAEQLQRQLNDLGIESQILGCEKPIGDIACEYSHVVGFATAAFRDARYNCKNVTIIGFTGVSKYYFDDPKFVFGTSEGIQWIKEDGTFDPVIFKPIKFVPKASESIPGILNKLSQ